MDEKLRQAVRLLKGLYSYGSGVRLPADSFLEQCAANILAIASEWQPIETAPKDGTHILVFCPDDGEWVDDDCEHKSSLVYVVKFDGERRDDSIRWLEAAGEGYSTFTPTHWMPLPPPPNE